MKVELNKLVDAIQYTKDEAAKEGKTYIYGTIQEWSFTESHSVTNCGEIWSAREAILNGAKFDEITYQSIKSDSGASINMCEKCVHTFVEYLQSLAG